MRLTIDGNAWNRGFWDGELGLPLRSCPYDVGTTERWSWSSGYIEGNAARNGYAVVRSTPKQQEKLAPGAEADAVPLRSTASASTPEETKTRGVNIARRSGVKVRRRLTRCLQTAQAVGQASMLGSSQYAAVSTWNNKQPDNRFSVSMIGQQFAPGQNSTPNSLSGVFSVPTPEGKWRLTTSAGTVLEPTKIKDKAKILAALDNLNASGSTAGAEGIRQAYNLAESSFDKTGVNRVILATDGDFNVGISDPEELKSFVERKRETGVYLSVLGFGRGNYNDE